MTQKVKILTDDIELQPTKDFIKLSDTIVSFIKGSEPKFSVGIYGDWGTGKSTLMKLVENKINENNDRKKGKILTIWFNAWRYEREEQVATIALMKTIAYAMAEHPIYDKISQSIWNGLKVIGKDLLKQAAREFISDDAIKDLEKVREKLKLLSKFEQETIYFDGLRVIEEEIAKVISSDNDSRVIIFIDDLDRCSPRKVLEVLESIKVFFDMKGFVFIIGLSDRTVTRLITKHYEDSGVNGVEYIQKIIQLPIRIPLWNSADIEKIIAENLSSKLDEKYANFVKTNKEIIAIAVQPNPREMKRFVNNLIVAMEVNSEILNNKKIDDKELLIIEALRMRWHDNYIDIISKQEIRDELIRLVKITQRERDNYIKSLKEADPKNLDLVQSRIRSVDDNLWAFLTSSTVKDTFVKISEWETHRRVVESTKQSVIPPSKWSTQFNTNALQAMYGNLINGLLPNHDNIISGLNNDATKQLYIDNALASPLNNEIKEMIYQTALSSLGSEGIKKIISDVDKEQQFHRGETWTESEKRRKLDKKLRWSKPKKDKKR